ncbi:hypothetical protein MEC_00800 [Bartonella alsatica IBS 382]|uniref:Uncharacterized protein n=1 Tax=Bartonella alsatica IBS 382 TaxID=1094551 RepID=J0PYK8_9HYPH|nr:hypothetical protein MEC_00800 [Bartonella alsatica IBS 382]
MNSTPLSITASSFWRLSRDKKILTDWKNFSLFI